MPGERSPATDAAEISLEDEQRCVRRTGWVGLVVNLTLAAIKLAAGILGNSQAVVADAVHSLSDLVTDAVLIIGVRYWMAPADADHPHGHRRIETMVTVSIGVVLALVALGLGEQAVRGLRSTHRALPGAIALAAALLSMAAKESLYWWTRAQGRQIGSSAVVANAWHHRTDALSSIPAAAAVLVALAEPAWSVVDPIGAMVVCLFILFASWQIIRPALAQLIDAGAPAEVRHSLETLALSVNGVMSAHALRTRYTGPKLIVDLHIEVEGELTVREGHAIGEAVRRCLLEQGPNVADCMVKVEPWSGT